VAKSDLHRLENDTRGREEKGASKFKARMKIVEEKRNQREGIKSPGKHQGTITCAERGAWDRINMGEEEQKKFRKFSCRDYICSNPKQKGKETTIEPNGKTGGPPRTLGYGSAGKGEKSRPRALGARLVNLIAAKTSKGKAERPSSIGG